MAYNPALDDENEPGMNETGMAVVIDIDSQALADEDRLMQLRGIRNEVGEAGLSDDDLLFLAQYELDPAQAETEHGANLAEYMPDEDLARVAADVIESFDWDHESRQDWYEREVKGVRMLGISSNVDGGADFSGASKAVHPMLAEACVQFQARTMGEVWPADGPVKTLTVGDADEATEQQADRVARYMNYLLNDVMPGAYEAEDMACLRLSLSGSVFKKVYVDPVYGHMDDYVPPDEFVVPYNAVDLRTAPRYTHVLFRFPTEVKRYQMLGHYRDVELGNPDERNLERVFYQEVKDTEGNVVWNRENDHRHTLLEQHVYLDLPGFEHQDENGEPTGLELPYVVTVDYDSRQTLAIRRNWREGDGQFLKREWFVHKKFIPGLGFYGYGYYHWIGSLTTAAIGALRALLDAAQFANLPGGYRSKAGRALSGEGPIAPGEFRETELQPEELSKAFFPLPYKEPSSVLFALLGHLEQAGHRFASTTDVMMGEGQQNTPVGTTLARIEQGQKIFSSIHRRIHRANRQEYKLLAEQIAENMPPQGYPFVYDGVPSQIALQDFDERVDIIPISNPEIATTTQRIIQGQLLLDMAAKAPDLYDRKEVNRRALSAARIPNIDEILLDTDKIPPRRGPVEENMAMRMRQPVKARPDEDHAAHQIVHQTWFMGLDPATNKELMPVYLAHLAEHAAWAYHIQMSQAVGEQLPADIMLGDAQDMAPEQEMAISIAAAQAAQLMAQQQAEQLTPEQIEAEAKAREEQRKDQLTQAEIERKNALARSEIERKDFLASAEVERADIAKDLELQAKLAPPALGQ